MDHTTTDLADEVNEREKGLFETIERQVDDLTRRYDTMRQVMRQLDPRAVLKRGYALVRDHMGSIVKSRPLTGDNLTIETAHFIIETEVKDARAK